MKRKEKRLSSRRRRTLRRVLMAAVTLFLVNRIFLVGLLFPIQAVRRCEEREDTGRTNLVCRDWAPEIYKTGLVYLTENENVTMLSAVRLSLYGWIEVYGVPLDCTEEGPIHGGWWTLYRKEEPSQFYVFGRIDDPDIDFLKVTVRHKEEPPEKNDEWQLMGFEWGLPRGDFVEKDGQSYFLLERYPVDWSDYPCGISITALGYDKEGNEIARMELEQGVFTISR